MMGSLGALGVGLSIVFGGFVLLLLAEVYYIVYRSNHRRPAKATAGADDDEEFAREAGLVGSFGGYTAAPDDDDDDDGDTNSFPDNNNNNNAVLFTIAEETKEDLLMVDSDLSPSSTIATPPAVAVKWPLAPPLPSAHSHLYSIGVIHPTVFSSPAFSVECEERFGATATATATALPQSGRRTFAALLRQPAPAEMLPSLQRESPSPEREYSGGSSSSDSSSLFSPSASPAAFVTAPSTPSAAD